MKLKILSLILVFLLLTSCNDNRTNSAGSDSGGNSAAAAALQTEYENYFQTISHSMVYDIRPIYFGVVDIDFDGKYEVFFVKEKGVQGWRDCFLWEIIDGVPTYKTEFYGFPRDGFTMFCKVGGDAFMYTHEEEPNQREVIQINHVKANEFAYYLHYSWMGKYPDGTVDNNAVFIKNGEELISEVEFNRLYEEFKSAAVKMPLLYTEKIYFAGNEIVSADYSVNNEDTNENYSKPKFLFSVNEYEKLVISG